MKGTTTEKKEITIMNQKIECPTCMGKSFEAGWEYSKIMDDHSDGWDEPVDVDEQLGATASMPEEDYITLKNQGEIPDARAYWRGWNAYKNTPGRDHWWHDLVRQE